MSPAGLRYLDNVRSRAGSINENYARELLELHTVGVDGGYDEDDIISVATLFTGWRIDRRLDFVFAPRQHDTSPVSMLGWTRPTDGDGMEHGISFLRHLAQLPATAENVCTKLARRFVADDPAPDLVQTMVTTWADTGSDIAAVLRSMIGHPAFASAPPKFNRPWDYLVQTIRSTHGRLDVTAPGTLRDAIGVIRDSGALPFRWPTPDGPPDVADAWLDPGALLARWDVTVRIVDPADDTVAFDPGELIGDALAATSTPSAAEVVDDVARHLRSAPATAGQHAAGGAVTGWEPDDVPDINEIATMSSLIVFAVLADPTGLTR